MQKTRHRSIQKGDVWVVDNANAVGHMQKGVRPHVVVTQVTGDTVTVAPCTSAPKKNHQYVLKILPTEQNGLTMVSYLLLSQSFAADTSLLREKIGHLDENEITRIQLEFVKYVTD